MTALLACREKLLLTSPRASSGVGTPRDSQGRILGGEEGHTLALEGPLPGAGAESFPSLPKTKRGSQQGLGVRVSSAGVRGAGRDPGLAWGRNTQGVESSWEGLGRKAAAQLLLSLSRKEEGQKSGSVKGIF